MKLSAICAGHLCCARPPISICGLIPVLARSKGIHWLKRGDDTWIGTRPNYNQEMRLLLQESQKPGRLRDYMEPLEMRDIEHSLCEWQKYLRVKLKGGKLKAKYAPTTAAQSW